MSGPAYDVVLAGRGGQGVVFLSRVMGQAALLQGLGVRTTETHGMAMRGGSVRCFVRFGPAYGPLFGRGTARLLMAVHAAEVAAGLPFLTGDGTVLVNTPDGPGPAGDRTVRILDADGIARQCGDARSANLALLGCAVAAVDGFPLAASSVEAAIAGIGSAAAVRINLDVFHRGMAAV